MPSSPATIFVDTSAWKAFYDEEDELHGEARNLMNAISSKEISVRAFITSDYVMDEIITLIRFAHSHGKAAEFARAILSSRATRIVYVGEEAFLKALGLFSESKDKEWSFKDCASFTLMRLLNITKAFTFDPHFRQAGFQTLPK